jgi:hypothetical protein
MESRNEQPVVAQPDAPAQPATEGNDAQDLDSLLAAYNTSEPPKSEPPKEPDDRLAAYEQRLAELEKREAQVRSQAEVSEVVRSVRGDLPIDENLVEAYLQVEATKDPRLVEAFTNRRRDPDQWKKIEAGLAKKLKASVGADIDQVATETRDAVDAAVRSASTRTPVEEAPPDIAAMSEAEFEQYKQTLR